MPALERPARSVSALAARARVRWSAAVVPARVPSCLPAAGGSGVRAQTRGRADGRGSGAGGATRRLVASMAASASPYPADAVAALRATRPTWQQMMLRVSDPEKSLKFYGDVMGMTHVDTLVFDDLGFTLYFLQSLSAEDAAVAPAPGTVEAHKALWSTTGTVLELTHNHGDPVKYHTGNEPGDSFGHVAFNVDDVDASCQRLEAAGVAFKKKPNEGRMKGLAFAYDPDGYWVEIVSRGDAAGTIAEEFTLSQCMLRIKDPKSSIPFYEALGMTVVRESTFDDFSLTFLMSVPDGVTPPADPADRASAKHFLGASRAPALELTFNFGEDAKPTPLANGNEDGRKGFGHIGFLVDDVTQACAALAQMGVSFVKEPTAGTMKGLAFARSPDGTWVEVVQRGGYDNEATPYYRDE